VEVPQPGCRALRKLLAAQADDDGRASGEFLAPAGGVRVVTPDRAGNQPRVGGEIFFGADVDQDRHMGRADQAGKSIG
jgi:hypothetical protein